MSTHSDLHPFSYVVLVLVGRDGAGPHDLKVMAVKGRVYWDAAPSQWYAEPKRLQKLGYLDARSEPGRTRRRTHYTLTDRGRAALEEWVRTPSPLPRTQNESIVRLLAADLVDPAGVLEGLDGMRSEIEEALEQVAAARAQWAELPHRTHLLEVNGRYATKLLELQREWLDEARRALRP